MSLYGMMRTGSSGMNAQASRLSTVADNIANTSTTGYKAASTEFSSLLLPSISGNYNSGSVQTSIRHGISNQGALTYTSSATDLAIDGSGFFAVEDASGNRFLTRSGSFVPNGDGELVNAAGCKLLGAEGANPTLTANSLDDLKIIKVGGGGLKGEASTKGVFVGNLDAGQPVVTGDLPSDNLATSEFTHKTSLQAYDPQGNPILLDIFYTKTNTDTWKMTIYNQADRDPATDSFPYTNGAILDEDLVFNPATGKLDLTATSDSDGTVDGIYTLPQGFAPNMPELRIDFSGVTELNYNFAVQKANVNGSPPNAVESVQIANDGTVYEQYENGDLAAKYRLAIVTVASPDELRVISGNLYAMTTDSGAYQLGFANSSGLGSVVSGALESSTVDLAQELTTMIESQRTYTANSKVFQTGADLMDVLVNLKR